MGYEGRAVPGKREAVCLDQSIPDGREDGGKEKDILENAIWIFGHRDTRKDLFDKRFGSGLFLFLQEFAVRGDGFFRFFSVESLNIRAIVIRQDYR